MQSSATETRPGDATPDSQPSDAALAQRVGEAAPENDTGAESELCRRFAPRVRLYGLRHLRDEAAAEDLMQQVLLTMIGHLRAGKLREPDRLASFVFGICRMTVLDLRRGQARRDRLLDAYGDLLIPAEPPAPNLDRARLALCLERLAERERTVLLMTFYEDMPTAELARELDLSQANVRVIRHRGLERLRNCVTGET